MIIYERRTGIESKSFYKKIGFNNFIDIEDTWHQVIK